MKLTNLSWRGASETLVLRAVFGVWYTTSWAATMIPADEPRTCRMVLAVMLLYDLKKDLEVHHNACNDHVWTRRRSYRERP
jgi:hypothetical protein